LRSGASVAANYREASHAQSEAEFISKIEQCAQEANARLLWLELLQLDCRVAAAIVEPIWMEADELIAVCITMSKHTKSRLDREP